MRTLLRSARLVFVVLGFAVLGTSPAGAQTETPIDASDLGEEAVASRIGYLLADPVYSAPRFAADQVATVTRKDRVRVTATDKEGWYRVVRLEDGATAGYAYDPYVSRFGPAGIGTASADSEPVEEGPLREVVFASVPAGMGALRVTNTWANVRRGPGLDYAAFGVVRPDTPFQVVAVRQGWGEVRLNGDPTTGYVAASLLHAPPVAEASDDATQEEMSEIEPADDETATADAPTSGRAAILSGAAGGGVEADDAQSDAPQIETLRDVLSTSGIDSDDLVYVTRTGHKFHREGCKHLRSRTFAIPLAEAMMDYSPCRSCKPLNRTDENGGN